LSVSCQASPTVYRRGSLSLPTKTHSRKSLFQQLRYYRTESRWSSSPEQVRPSREINFPTLVVILVQPSVSSSLQINNRCFSASPLPVESAPFFIPSTSFCSPSSWFTSSCMHHHITVLTFTVTIYPSLDLLFQKSSVSKTLTHLYPNANPFLCSLSGSIWTAFMDLGLELYLTGTGICLF